MLSVIVLSPGPNVFCFGFFTICFMSVWFLVIVYLCVNSLIMPASCLKSAFLSALVNYSQLCLHMFLILPLAHVCILVLSFPLFIVIDAPPPAVFSVVLLMFSWCTAKRSAVLIPISDLRSVTLLSVWWWWTILKYLYCMSSHSLWSSPLHWFKNVHFEILYVEKGKAIFWWSNNCYIYWNIYLN